MDLIATALIGVMNGQLLQASDLVELLNPTRGTLVPKKLDVVFVPASLGHQCQRTERHSFPQSTAQMGPYSLVNGINLAVQSPVLSTTQAEGDMADLFDSVS